MTDDAPVALDIRVLDQDELKVKGCAQLVLRGRLDTETAPKLEELLRSLGTPDRALMLDMSELEFVTSAGIRVIMTARKRLAEGGGRCAFSRLQPQVDRVFQIVKALQGVTMLANEQEQADFLDELRRSED